MNYVHPSGLQGFLGPVAGGGGAKRIPTSSLALDIREFSELEEHEPQNSARPQVIQRGRAAGDRRYLSRVSL